MQQLNNVFSGMIDEQGNIYCIDITQKKTHIGMSLKRYTELENTLSEVLDKAEKYKQQLIDAGIIKKELTAEEKIEQLSQQVAMLTQYIQKLAGDKDERNAISKEDDRDMGSK